MIEQDYQTIDICRAIGCKKAETGGECESTTPDGLCTSRRIELFFGGGFALRIKCKYFEPKFVELNLQNNTN